MASLPWSEDACTASMIRTSWCACYVCLRVLLDQLLQYEPLSEDEDEATDYSSSDNETVGKKLFKTAHAKEVSMW